MRIFFHPFVGALFMSISITPALVAQATEIGMEGCSRP